MKRTACSIATVVLAGCPKNEKSVETLISETPSPEETPAPQLVAAYLVKNGELEEGCYWEEINIQYQTGEKRKASIGYKPEGVQGSYADDQLLLSMSNWPSRPPYILVSIDVGLDGNLDFGTAITGETPSLSPFAALDHLEQVFFQRDYTRLVFGFADRIREIEDIKALQEVQPQ